MLPLPEYISYGGEQSFSPPHTLHDSEIFVFSLAADRKVLQTLFDKCLNALTPGFEYRSLDQVIIVFHRVKALIPGDANIAIEEEGEVTFFIPFIKVEKHFLKFLWGTVERLLSTSSAVLGVFVPYIFLNSSPALITGREVYGYPKQWGEIKFPWIQLIPDDEFEQVAEQIGQEIKEETEIFKEIGNSTEKDSPEQTKQIENAYKKIVDDVIKTYDQNIDSSIDKFTLKIRGWEKKDGTSDKEHELLTIDFADVPNNSNSDPAPDLDKPESDVIICASALNRGLELVKGFAQSMDQEVITMFPLLAKLFGLNFFEALANRVLSLTLPTVFLKQFRDAKAGTKACYQAIIEAEYTADDFQDCQLFLTNPPDVDITIKYLESHPIAQELGLKPVKREEPERFRGKFWLKAKSSFRLEEGKIIRESVHPPRG